MPNSETPKRRVVMVHTAFTFNKTEESRYLGSVYDMQTRRYAVKWPAGQKFIADQACMRGTILILELEPQFDTRYNWVVLPYDNVQVE